MAPNFFRRFRSGQVVNFAVVGVGLPLLAGTGIAGGPVEQNKGL